jgi:hypothetical protein
VTIGCVVLAVATIAIGTLLGFQGEYPHVRLYNPVLMDRLEQHLSVCRH